MRAVVSRVLVLFVSCESRGNLIFLFCSFLTVLKIVYLEGVS